MKKTDLLQYARRRGGKRLTLITEKAKKTMSSNSKIEWTECTWNVSTGCTQISPGCEHCYARIMTKRLAGTKLEKYKAGFDKVVTHRTALEEVSTYKKPTKVFVNSMSDLFHKDVSDDFIEDTFSVMNRFKQHIFQVLTKRSKRQMEFGQKLVWTENIWAGVSVENNDFKFRIDHLRKSAAQNKFISFEPLLGAITDVDLEGIDWVIVGGESGAGARPMEREWVIPIRDKCIELNIPFFFKQWGGRNKKKAGRLLDGREWLEMPDDFKK